MAQIKLSSGREVSIARIDVQDIYIGWVSGFQNIATQKQRASVREIIAKRFVHPEAVLIIDAQEPILPRYRCIAELWSSPVKADADYDLSMLVVCWFVESVDVNLQAITQQALFSIDWDAYAEDESLH